MNQRRGFLKLPYNMGLETLWTILNLIINRKFNKFYCLMSLFEKQCLKKVGS